MAISLSCPGCEKKYKVDEQHAGKKIRCKNCAEMMTIPNPAPPKPKDDFFDDWNAVDDDGPQKPVAKSAKAPMKKAPPPLEVEDFTAGEDDTAGDASDEFDEPPPPPPRAPPPPLRAC